MTKRKILHQLSCGWTVACAVFLLCVATVIGTQAQTFTKLLDFNGTNGAGPLYDSLVQGRDGNLYGPTSGGGAYGYGTVFKMTPGGTLTTLYSFGSPERGDGVWPMGGLVLATNGNFYGTTNYLGDCGSCDYPSGTVFRITPEGKLTTLYNFDFGDGAYPTGALVQGTDGNFYGTTSRGGDFAEDWAYGEVFKMTPEGGLTQLHVFIEGDDSVTPFAGLVQACCDGNFYGTTLSDGGSVFEITPLGRFAYLHLFGGPEGSYPQAALIQATDGRLYGTTEQGGAFGCGTIFRITLKGSLRDVHSFDGTDGCTLQGPILQATDGNLYGTTSAGGANNSGTLFKLARNGTLTTLHDFQGTDGSAPVGGLVQATSGKFYGTTSAGGISGDGTVFSLDMGLGPFVAFVHGAGKVGQTGGILGQGLTGTTSVTLNGIPATFTVVSDTFIKATVPAGATTGYVTVTTPTGTLKSRVPFYVLK